MVGGGFTDWLPSLQEEVAIDSEVPAGVTLEKGDDSDDSVDSVSAGNHPNGWSTVDYIINQTVLCLG
jgi:hypothetical protein